MDVRDWAIIGGLFGLVASILGHLYYRTSKFHEFLAKDVEREKQWYRWREGFERRMEEYISSQADWRHKELMPALDRIKDVLTRVQTTLENMKGLD